MIFGLTKPTKMKNYTLKKSLLISFAVLLLCTQCKSKEFAEAETAGAVDVAEAATESETSNGITGKNVSTTTATNGAVSNFAVNSSTSTTEVKDESRTTNESVSTTQQEKTERKLLKEGTLSWETSDIGKTHQQILDAIKKYNAYASNDEQISDDYKTTNSMEIRVPASQFDIFINDISKDVHKFDVKKISVLDVTEEFIDVTARIKTKKELEQHYYDLLKRTKNVSEILEVEQQLNNVRNDIESAEGRLKYLNDRVSLGTITISFYEVKSTPIGFFGEIGKSFSQGWNGILYFILFILKIWPLILIASTVMFFVIRSNRKK